jgi:hypothetical protein
MEFYELGNDIFSLCLYNIDHLFPLSCTLSTTNSTSSYVRVMTGYSMTYFLFFHTSSTYIGFLIFCEGCTPLFVTCTLSSLAYDVSPFLVCCWLFVLFVVVVLLGLYALRCFLMVDSTLQPFWYYRLGYLFLLRNLLQPFPWAWWIMSLVFQLEASTT